MLKIISIFVLSAVVIPADEISWDEFAKLHKELTTHQEAWKQIPWQIDLIQAQHLAAEQGKPIFIWAMDGHPLGCT